MKTTMKVALMTLSAASMLTLNYVMAADFGAYGTKQAAGFKAEAVAKAEKGGIAADLATKGPAKAVAAEKTADVARGQACSKRDQMKLAQCELHCGK